MGCLWLGLAAVVGSLVLMVIVPLAQEPPEVTGATLWALLAATGIAVVLVATALERWKARIGAGMHRLGVLMSGWE